MARQRSDERRTSILDAAVRVIARNGLGAASTAAIAKEAGVSNGSLFVYFPTKSDLLNALYVQLKLEMGLATTRRLPSGTTSDDPLRHLWDDWLSWATKHPERRRAVAQLEVAEDITPDSKAEVQASQQELAAALRLNAADGPMAQAPRGFALLLASAVADTTVDAVVRNPDAAGPLSEAGFEAVRRILAD